MSNAGDSERRLAYHRYDVAAQVYMSFDRSSKPGSGRSSAPVDAAPALGPGKQTLTSLLDASMVQRRAAAPAPASDVHGAAAHGTSGNATALPHHAQIQQSFGRHHVGHIKAHVGGRATEGAQAMGASAFAMGEQVGFAAAPDLHTAAHEAAHVVQQRGGVQLKGGVGEVGDPYEQHADAVADLVVQGKSSEALLEQHAMPSSMARRSRRPIRSRPAQSSTSSPTPRSATTTQPTSSRITRPGRPTIWATSATATTPGCASTRPA
jgi:hypothetical protein